MVAHSVDNRFKRSGLNKDQQVRAQSELSELYDSVSPLLRAVLRRILASNAEAEELLEHTFLAAAQGILENSEGGEAMRESWLLLTARSQAIHRVRAARKQLPLNSPAISSDQWQVKVQEIRLLDSRRDLLRRLTDQLPAEQRRLLDLVVFGGQTEEEIAKATNEPLGRVRDQVRAAFAFVRQRVQTVMGTWTAGL